MNKPLPQLRDELMQHCREYSDPMNGRPSIYHLMVEIERRLSSLESKVDHLEQMVWRDDGSELSDAERM